MAACKSFPRPCANRRVLLQCLFFVTMCHWGTPGVFGQEPKGEILVQHCTISLIDHVTLAADRAGILGQVPFEEGDEVAEKALVAQLINDEAAARLELSVRAAESDIGIRVAEKTRDVAEAELRQAEVLNQTRQVYTEFEMRRLRLTLDQTILEREKAVHEQRLKSLEQAVAQAQLKSHDVVSTFGGMVVRVFKKRGEAVQQGEPLLEIASDKRLRIEGYLPVEQARLLKPGDEVLVELEGETPANVPVRGRLRFVDVSVQRVTQEVRIWAEVDNTDRVLKPGQQATLRIKASQR